jgi:hypothetical protein
MLLTEIVGGAAITSLEIPLAAVSACGRREHHALGNFRILLLLGTVKPPRSIRSDGSIRQKSGPALLAIGNRLPCEQPSQQKWGEEERGMTNDGFSIRAGYSIRAITVLTDATPWWCRFTAGLPT